MVPHTIARRPLPEASRWLLPLCRTHQAAAERAAAANADPSNAPRYGAAATAASVESPWEACYVTVASSARIPPESVVDTTGAGDAFIGSVVYGLVTGMKGEKILQLGSVVAAAKCTALGARPGLPRRDQLTHSLLM